MALRVLLADESSTIKKVMQLALSDFAVEVKSVPVGLDVLPVAKSFQPDIVFADVLLAKRNGYEVCGDLKGDPETKHVPVVLMWSGFMEVDENKIAESQANGRLEKPFDADHLRNLVNSLVQKTKANPVSSFLTFPAMPEFQEAADSAAPATALSSTIEDIYAIPEDSDEHHPLDVPGEEFSAVPLTSPKESPVAEEQDEGGWAHQDLTKFKINIPEQTDAEDFAAKFVIPQDDELANAHFEVSGDFEEVHFGDEIEGQKLGPDLTERRIQGAPERKLTAVTTEAVVSKVEKSVKEQMMESLRKGPSAAQPNTQSQGDLKADMMEKVVREEAREMIEAICWKVLPEIAERIVREEINKILRNTEKSV